MAEEHITSVFDRDLEAIQGKIMKMGGLVETAILDAAQSLETRDEELAEQVRAGDKVIDELEHLINEDAARLIALHAIQTAVARRVGVRGPSRSDTPPEARTQHPAST